MKFWKFLKSNGRNEDYQKVLADMEKNEKNKRNNYIELNQTMYGYEEKINDEKHTKIITQNGKSWQKALKIYITVKLRNIEKCYSMIPFI